MSVMPAPIVNTGLPLTLSSHTLPVTATGVPGSTQDAVEPIVPPPISIMVPPLKVLPAPMPANEDAWTEMAYLSSGILLKVEFVMRKFESESHSKMPSESGPTWSMVT